MAEAILAGGCFWCVEAVFRQVAGVRTVASGYIGGTIANPTYQQVCSGTTGHAEAIRVDYDETRISYDDLLAIFFATHDPTQINRQGQDIGTQYRSAIFILDTTQRAQAEAAIARAQAEHQAMGQPGSIVTTIEGPAPWWPAEVHHQDYWAHEGQSNPYCLAVIPSKLAKLHKISQTNSQTKA